MTPSIPNAQHPVTDPRELVVLRFTTLVAGQSWARREGQRLALADLVAQRGGGR